MPEHDSWDEGRLVISETEATEICLGRPEAKEQFGGRPD